MICYLFYNNHFNSKSIVKLLIFDLNINILLNKNITFGKFLNKILRELST